MILVVSLPAVVGVLFVLGLLVALGFALRSQEAARLHRLETQVDAVLHQQEAIVRILGGLMSALERWSDREIADAATVPPKLIAPASRVRH